MCFVSWERVWDGPESFERARRWGWNVAISRLSTFRPLPWHFDRNEREAKGDQGGKKEIWSEKSLPRRRIHHSMKDEESVNFHFPLIFDFKAPKKTFFQLFKFDWAPFKHKNGHQWFYTICECWGGNSERNGIIEASTERNRRSFRIPKLSPHSLILNSIEWTY